MKFIKGHLATLAVLAVSATLLLTGCAHMSDKSKSGHDLLLRAALLPPGWNVVTVAVTNSPSANNVAQYASTFVAPTNQSTSFWQSWAAPRPRVYVAFEEHYQDSSSGGGTFLFTDPAASQVNFSRVNQNGLGGTHSVSVGQLSSTITSNAVSAITAGASGVGNIIGAAANAAAK